MATIMAMRVKGGDQTHNIGPIQSLVVVQDEEQFRKGVLQMVRQAAQRDIESFGIEEPYKSELLRTIKMELYPTGLDAFPNTVEEAEALAEKVIHEHNESNFNPSQQ